MKSLLVFLTACCFIFKINAQIRTVNIYYTPVNMPASMANTYYASMDPALLAKDLSTLLQEATGTKYQIIPHSPQSGSGIYLLLDSTNHYQNEEGLVESDGKTYVRIKAKYVTGISYAMYTWLQEMGFHFFLPGENWAIIPALKSHLSLPISKKYKPYFRLRMFNASGGIFPVKGLDENLLNKKEWMLWYRRNRMGSDFIQIDGHIGEVFNIVHKEQIEKDSAILAPIEGKRQYGVGGKLDPTYKKGVALFSNWIVEEFKKEKPKAPSFLPFKKYYTVDAGDGLNYCHTPECERQFKTVSDQVFSIVNETARKIRVADQRAGVSTLAYTERADTPTTRIEPNVHVQVVPSAFQTVSTQTELMQRWAKKTSNISQYDFLNIGVWSYDHPFFNLDRYFRYMRFLKTLNIHGMTFETSLSKFGSGVQQYFILQFLCNPLNTSDALLEQFCKHNFGKAALPVKMLLKEWYFSNVHLETNFTGPSFYEDELGRFIKYLDAAGSTAGIDDKIRKRIDELKGYLVYLCMYYELFSDHRIQPSFAVNPSLRKQKAEEVLSYTWKLYSTMIFHNTQLNDMLKRYINESRKENWDYNSSDEYGKLNADIPALIKTSFEAMKKKYLPQAFPLYEISDDFMARYARYSADSISITTIDETSFGNFIYPMEFYCARPGVLRIYFETGSSSIKNPLKEKIAIVGVESSDFKYIKNDFIYREKSKGLLTYNIPVTGHYKLYLSQFNATHVSYVIYPGNHLFYFNKKSLLMNAMLLQDPIGEKFYPNEYLGFYAPKTDSIIFSYLYHDANNTIRFFTPSGKPVPINTASQPQRLTAAIPPELKDNFIFYNNTIFRWPPVLKNTAPYYFYFRYPMK